MYSGTTFGKKSGNIIGVHQRIDKLARRGIEKLGVSTNFPSIKRILSFEGKNGPDDIKFTTMSHDKPLHFINPKDISDKVLINQTLDHIKNLSDALRIDDQIRASYEAAWMAHAITDGLTPAHHYPLTDKVIELWGKPRNEFDTLREKSIIKGDSKRDTVKKNWQYWGAKGVMTSHVMYELGVALAIIPTRQKTVYPNHNDLINLERLGFESIYIDAVSMVDSMDMYNEFVKKGWNTKLANDTKKELLPIIVKMVVLGWYQAILDSRKNDER